MTLQPSIVITSNNSKVQIPELNTFKTVNDLASNSDIISINTKITDNTNDILALTSNVDYLSGKIDDNDSDINSKLSTQISKLQSQITDLQSQITTLKSKHYYKTPTLTSLFYSSDGLCSGDITLSQSISSFDAICIVYSTDDTSQQNINIQPLWVYQKLYDYGGSYINVMTSHIYWYITRSSLFSTTWQLHTENSVIHAIYGVTW